MCGITGYIDFKNGTPEATLDSMVTTLKHRGPDARGQEKFQMAEAAIGLGHARLAVIDLSPAARQPMNFQQYAMVFNGEIYNYKEVAKDLGKLGHQFKTSSDSEVILHAFSEWGPACVDRFIGMFAIVLLDRENEKIYFFRDRAGVKPLFVYRVNGLLLFASELKAFHQHPDFRKEINQQALSLFFQLGYVPSPHCIFKNCSKIKSGCFSVLDLKDQGFSTHEYWQVHKFFLKEKLDLPYQEAKQEVNAILNSACEYRIVADVPVGVFLSGGYDSSIVTAMLQSNRTKKLKTFTIGFEEGNNEAPAAKEIAAYLGTEHAEYYCTYKEAQDIIPNLPYYYDEPFADSSAIPTTLISQKARQEVTVALSADAGDEIFAGYSQYQKVIRYHKLLNRIPDFLKGSARRILKTSSAILPKSKQSLKNQLAVAGKSLDKDPMQQVRKLFKSYVSIPDEILGNLFADEIVSPLTGFDMSPDGFRDELSYMTSVDYDTYLESDILAKVDRATMSVSLEGREPLLDHRLIEFAARLPTEFKFGQDNGKKILKDIAHDYIPKELLDRPKTGFSIPIHRWLAGDLEFLIKDYLNEQALSESGMFNVPYVLSILKKYDSGYYHFNLFVWKLLTFQMWYKRWMQ